MGEEAYQIKSISYGFSRYVCASVFDVDEAVLDGGLNQLMGYLGLGLIAGGRYVNDGDFGSRSHGVFGLF